MELLNSYRPVGEHLCAFFSCVLLLLTSSLDSGAKKVRFFFFFLYILPSAFTVFFLFLHLSYRKIPGDQCEGGFQPKRKETNLRRMCISNALYPLVSFAFSEK